MTYYCPGWYLTPAQKSAKTRKENKAKRSAAARKAWKTLRANKIKAKRKAAAKKAWKTRKAS